MPIRFRKPPAYRLHKPTGQAVVRIDGRDYYLGKHGTDASQEAYRRLIAEWAISPRPAAASTARQGLGVDLTIDELVLAYWDRHVVVYYIKDGRPTSERDNNRQALRFLRRLYGALPARDFGPQALKAVRQAMIDAGRCRTLINKDVHRVRAMFKWAASEQLIPGRVYEDLRTVAALEKGRSTAKERVPVGEVPESVVERTLSRLSAQVAAMVRLQLLTAARPGEVAMMRPRDIDGSDPTCWIYRPESHKTQHRGRERVILIGPRAQEVLRPWLDRAPDAYCFSPAEVIGPRLARERVQGRPRRPKPGGRYTKDSYRVAIQRACDRVFPHPTLAGVRAKDRTEEQRAELEAWRRRHRWHPHQLRHTRATEIRRRFDTEAAQVILGHAKPDTTVIYAERDLARARDVMREIG